MGSKDPSDGQVMLSESKDFSTLERFEYQPVKSVSITVKPKCTSKLKHEDIDFELNGTKLVEVNSSTHFGIKRSTTLSNTGVENIQHNITKARRTAYSLLASRLHGVNGLDPLTSFHIVKIYILPVLLYGLEIIQLNKHQIEQLELYQKKLVKQILSVPTNAQDAAVYILSGLLPIEAQLDGKILTFFNNVWFISVKKVLWKL